MLFPIDNSELYILSVSQPNVKENKLRAIKKHFPEFAEENIFQVSNSMSKMQVLEDLYKKHNKQIIFLEDTAKTLLVAEEQFPFVTGYHISSLIP